MDEVSIEGLDRAELLPRVAVNVLRANGVTRDFVVAAVAS